MADIQSIKPNKKIILLNGPPHVGKDLAAGTICAYISDNARWMNPRHMKMSEPLKKATHALYAAFESWDHYDMSDALHEKGLCTDVFLGLSPRQAYIEMSERMLKPLHGEEALGWIMRKRIHRAQQADTIVISDSGFIEEQVPLVSYVGEENVMLIELHAVDRTYEGDSRGYIAAEFSKRWPKATVRRIENTFGDMHDKELFKVMCKGATKKFLRIDEVD